MHEMTLMGEVREIVVQAAKVHKFKRVKRVVLEIGKLSGVQVEAMRFCFDVVMEGTPLPRRPPWRSRSFPGGRGATTANGKWRSPVASSRAPSARACRARSLAAPRCG